MKELVQACADERVKETARLVRHTLGVVHRVLFFFFFSGFVFSLYVEFVSCAKFFIPPKFYQLSKGS
jgi:hypothetical protein